MKHQGEARSESNTKGDWVMLRSQPIHEEIVCEVVCDIMLDVSVPWMHVQLTEILSHVRVGLIKKKRKDIVPEAERQWGEERWKVKPQTRVWNQLKDMEALSKPESHRRCSKSCTLSPRRTNQSLTGRSAHASERMGGSGWWQPAPRIDEFCALESLV